MSKPDWKDAPEWANYLAQDQDGSWFWFEREPESLRTVWYSQGRQEQAEVPKSWKQTLERRP